MGTEPLLRKVIEVNIFAELGKGHKSFCSKGLVNTSILQKRNLNPYSTLLSGAGTREARGPIASPLFESERAWPVHFSLGWTLEGRGGASMVGAGLPCPPPTFGRAPAPLSPLESFERYCFVFQGSDILQHLLSVSPTAAQPTLLTTHC